MALCPIRSSSRPFGRLGFPFIKSLMMHIILTTNSQSLSFCSRVFRTSGGFLSKPSLQFAFVHARAFSNSSLSYISSLIRRISSTSSTDSTRIPRYSSINAGAMMEPPIPMQIEPIWRYDFPLMVAAATAARPKRRSFSFTSSGILVSSASWTSCP